MTTTPSPKTYDAKTILDRAEYYGIIVSLSTEEDNISVEYPCNIDYGVLFKALDVIKGHKGSIIDYLRKQRKQRGTM